MPKDVNKAKLLLSFHSDWYFRGMDAASILIFLHVQDSVLSNFIFCVVVIGEVKHQLVLVLKHN